MTFQDKVKDSNAVDLKLRVVTLWGFIDRISFISDTYIMTFNTDKVTILWLGDQPQHEELY